MHADGNPPQEAAPHPGESQSRDHEERALGRRCSHEPCGRQDADAIVCGGDPESSRVVGVDAAPGVSWLLVRGTERYVTVEICSGGCADGC
jgi:hypothetical protein